MNGNIFATAERGSAFAYVETFYILLAIVLIVGLAICVIITFFAVKRVKKKMDEYDREGDKNDSKR